MTVLNTSVAIGLVLKECRLSQGISLAKLASLVDSYGPVIARTERGCVSPRVDTLQPLCGALGITLAELFARAEALQAESLEVA